VPDGRALGTAPHNIDGEKGFLGGLFVNNRVFKDVAPFLRPEHFAYAPHGLIFDAATRIIQAGNIADPITLKRYCETNETLADIGGPAYLADLAASVVTPINAAEYGWIIYDLYRRRAVIPTQPIVRLDLVGS